MTASYYTPSFQAHASSIETCDASTCYVKITKTEFVPKTLTVKLGTTIVWINTDDKSHTVTSGIPGEITLPLNSKLLQKGDTYEFTFDYSGFYKGTYQYFDQTTGVMRGQIIIEPASENNTTAAVQTVNVDFTNPASGVEKVLLSSGTIKSMEADPSSNTLTVNLENVQGGGILTISLNRSLIDSIVNDTDAQFTVLVSQVVAGEHEGFYDETSSTPTDRTLRIVVPDTATQIKIVGTQAVPEFPFALLVIAITFTGMITVYRLRNRLGPHRKDFLGV